MRNPCKWKGSGRIRRMYGSKPYFDIDEFGPLGIPEIGAPGLDFDADPVLLDVMRQKGVED